MAIELTELSRHGAQETQGERVNAGVVLKQLLLFEVVLVSSAVDVLCFQDILKDAICRAAVVHICAVDVDVHLPESKARSKKGNLDADGLYLALQGSAVPPHLLPALAHTLLLLPLLGPEAQGVDVPVLTKRVAGAGRSLNL